MKFVTLLLLLALIASESMAQFSLPDVIKKKVEEKVEQKTEEAIDKTLDGKKEDKTTKEEKTSEQATTSESKAETKANIKTYSKYDFVAGENVVFFENFLNDAIGDFPSRWNTNGSGEVVNIDGSPDKWLQIKTSGYYFPELKEEFPENYTLEYDFILKNREENDIASQILFILLDGNYSKPDEGGAIPGKSGVKFTIGNNGIQFSAYNHDAYTIDGSNDKPIEMNKIQHIAFWVQKNRIRVYVGDSKVIDAPRVIQNDMKFNMLRIEGNEEFPSLISNIRLAVGAPDTRSKLITEGKFVSHGILFAVGSDIIKPESYGAIKEIATILQENATLKIKVIGHTDSDGDDAANMTLSKKRAMAVKAFLTSEFKIAATRLETDGKGESEPVCSNDTPEGKSNNRRVEFIKQ